VGNRPGATRRWGKWRKATQPTGAPYHAGRRGGEFAVNPAELCHRCQDQTADGTSPILAPRPTNARAQLCASASRPSAPQTGAPRKASRSDLGDRALARSNLRRSPATLLMVGVLLVGWLPSPIAHLRVAPGRLPHDSGATFYPGASPDVIGILVTAPLERQFARYPA